MVSSALHCGLATFTLIAFHHNALAFTPLSSSFSQPCTVVSRVPSNSYCSINSALQVGSYLDSLSSNKPEKSTNTYVVSPVQVPSVVASSAPAPAQDNSFMTPAQTQAILNARETLEQRAKQAKESEEALKEMRIAAAIANKKASVAAAAARVREAEALKAANVQARAKAAAQAKIQKRAADKAKELEEAKAKAALLQAKIDATLRIKEEKEAALQEKARMEAVAKENLVKAKAEAVLQIKLAKEAEIKAKADAKEALAKERIAAAVRSAEAKRNARGL